MFLKERQQTAREWLDTIADTRHRRHHESDDVNKRTPSRLGDLRPLPYLHIRQDDNSNNNDTNADAGDDDGDGDGGSGRNTAIIIVAIVLAVSFVAFIGIAIWRRKRGNKKYAAAASGEDTESSHQMRSRNPAAPNAQTVIDRHTSVRSVITLPAYRPDADTDERVLGREGERDGVDTVIEQPTAEDAENLREEEMETLYQIRQTRRQQNAEREERRRQRLEAQQRRDNTALAQIRASARTAQSDTHALDDLRANVGRIQESRNRSVSSVSYGDLGVARHDGSRLRASSNDSERMGLLSDAASIAASTRSGAHSPAPRHRRVSSVASLDSEFAAGGWPTTRSRAGSRATSRSRANGSSPELLEADEEDGQRPPPEYVNVSLDDGDRARSGSNPPAANTEPPPDYPGPRESWVARGSEDSLGSEGRTSREAPGLPTLRIGSLPEIHVSEPMSAHVRETS